MNKIKYLAYYDLPGSKVKRGYPLSGATKIAYEIGALQRAGYNVDIISAARCCENKFAFHRGQKIKVSDNVQLLLMPSCGGISILARAVRHVWCTLYLLFTLLAVKRNEVLVVYHSIGYQDLVIFCKKVKKFHLCLELNEIYQDVAPLSKHKSKKEKEIIGLADSYIFATELLDRSVNTFRKPSTVIYGTYDEVPRLAKPEASGVVNVVYAGTLDPNKGGAGAAAAAAAYLPDNYCIHILGFGSRYEVEFMQNLVNGINAKSKARVVFHQPLHGEAFNRFLQTCQIGLSTQNPDAAFNASSFPSKILTYMSNGLKVVSIDIPAIRESKVSPYITFYARQTPSDIAAAIMQSHEQAAIDSRSSLQQLDADLLHALKQLFTSENHR